MTFSQDDLTPLVLPRQKEALGFHQGVIQAWNSETGQNTVNIAGAFVNDLPILNTGEAIVLKVGHVVAILRFRSTYFILGRITIPQDPQFAGASVAFGSAGAEGIGFGVTTTMMAIVGFNMPVPSWADEAVVFVSGFCNMRNTRAVADYLTFEVGVEGGSGGGAIQGFAANGAADLGMDHSIHASTRNLLDAAQLADGIINLQGRAQASGANWLADPANYMVIHGIAIFRSVT